MRILHVVPTYIPALRYGGPIYSVHGLCKSLVDLGHEIEVITSNVDGDQDSAVPLNSKVDIDGVGVWYYPSRVLRRLYWSPSMKDALKKKIPGFDLVHLHSIFLWPTWAAACVARKNAVPYILSPRGMLVKYLVRQKNSLVKNLWLNLIERRNLEEAARIHFTSSIEIEEAKQFHYQLPDTIHIPNGVNISKPANKTNQNDRDPYLLFLGRVNWKKGLDRLIPALTYVPDIKLIIAGNDEDSFQHQLEHMALKCGVADRVQFIGHVSGIQKDELLINASILVLPSYSENFGNVVLEALAVGVPVVVTPEVGAAEVVRKVRGGLVVDGTPETLGKTLNDFMASPEKRKRMGTSAQELVAERYSWDAIARQMEKEYRTILNPQLH